MGLALPATVAVSSGSSAPAAAADERGSRDTDAAADPRSRRSTGGVRWGLAADAGFAGLFIGLSRAGSSNDLWRLVVAQLAALAAVCVVGAMTERLLLPPARIGWLAALSVVAGVLGVICYFLAAHAGLLAVTAVITSLYPAATVLLARVLLRERLTTIRTVGLCLGAGSVALIALAAAL